MSTLAERPTRSPITRSQRARTRGKPRGNAFETFSWYFFRVSGLALIFLALWHLTYQNLIVGVDRIDYAFVAQQWASPFWRAFDWLLLMLALLHGMNGLRIVVDDYVRSAGWRLTLNSLLALVTLVLFVLGTSAIMTFNPVPVGQ